MNYPVNEYDSYANKPKSMQDLMGKFEIGREKSEHEHEFQEVCSDLEKDFGKLIWTLPYKKGMTPHKIKEAGKIARQRGVLKYPYLLGVLKKL